MRTKLWVDDERPAPDDTWDVAKTSEEAKEQISWFFADNAEVYEEISLDHDLGGDDTSMKIIDFLEYYPVLWPNSITLHTQNPVGRNNLTRAINASAPKHVELFLYYW